MNIFCKTGHIWSNLASIILPCLYKIYHSLIGQRVRNTLCYHSIFDSNKTNKAIRGGIRDFKCLRIKDQVNELSISEIQSTIEAINANRHVNSSDSASYRSTLERLRTRTKQLSQNFFIRALPLAHILIITAVVRPILQMFCGIETRTLQGLCHSYQLLHRISRLVIIPVREMTASPIGIEPSNIDIGTLRLTKCSHFLRVGRFTELWHLDLHV